uniref:F-box domain-containing protein n=1 Tax=Oryza rufipogon TaxID=4529 RepID=A0A0E0NMN7_ORYRU
MERERGRRTMEEAWIDRLPQDLLQRVIPLETPRDACRAAAVSQAFRAVADSDVVWGKFQPDDSSLQLADGELFPPPRSKKERFLRLSAGLLLLPDRRRLSLSIHSCVVAQGMWLDRGTGARCYMLSARALVIIWGDTPRYWRWIPLADSSRFEEGAELIDVCWMEIRCNIDSRILSPNSTYAAFMVFKIAEGFYGLDTPLKEGTVSLGGRESRREVAFTSIDPRPPQGSAAYPQKRADGWMEVELGEFFNENGEDGEVGISLMSKGPNWKRGLIKPDSSKGAEASPSMEEGEACDDCECEIARLPEELLSAAISLTAPRDAFRAAAVSRAFRAAADSDAVWASFLPRDLPDLADGELSPAPPSKKDLFLRLSAGHYHLLPDRLKIAEEFYQLDTVDATVNLGGSKSSREVALTRSRRRPEEEISAVLFPRTRADGWMEVELGEFFNEEGEDGNVNIRIFGKGPNWKKGLIVEESSSMAMEEEEAAACEIARLPEELLVEVLSLTGPRDASRAAADSDAVWSRFLPRGLPRLARRELPRSPPPPPSRKAHFLRLSAGPLLLPRKLMSMWLDREKGAKCYMLSARALQISWGDSPQYWSWIPLADSRFKEGAELLSVCWLEIRGKLPGKKLSQNTNYAAYLVYKIADRSYGLDFPFQEASVSIGGSITARQRIEPRAVVLAEDIENPQKRADGWMELKLGELYNEGGDDGEVCISFMETKGGHWKSGLVSMWLDRETGFKCYMLSARALQIVNLTHSWRWISLTGSSRFSEVVEFLKGYRVEVCGKIPCKMLSGNSNYAAYIVFVVAEDSCGLASVWVATVGVGGRQSTRQVCLDSSNRNDYYYEGEIEVPQDGSVILPQERADGWMELELGEFYNQEGNNQGEIARLPVELLSAVISRAAPRPRDACRASAVSPAFRAAADSDDVWSRFLPRDVPDLADGELSPPPPSNKALFLRLSGSDGNVPLLLPDRLRGIWFDRETGAKCYVLSARTLVIKCSETSDYRRWIPLADSRFAEAVEFMDAPPRMEIRSKIDSMVLTPNSTYAAFMVFKIADGLYELDTSPHDATVSIGENESRREVAFTGRYPERRADGWMEVELGEFFNEDGEDGAVYMRLMSEGPNRMRGLIFYFQPPRTHTHSTTIFSFSVFFFSFAIKPDSRTEGSMEEEGEGLCEIARLPEELLSAAISRASPRDACHAAAVSPAFRAAADSDAVWASFLPRDLPDLADGELSPAPASKKELFLRLSDGPYLLSDRLMSMWLDRETGAKCYMLSARSLVIIWGDTPHYWRWIPLTDSRFAEGAELIDVCWLEIRGRIHSKMLSPNSTYAAYMVFKIADEFYGLDAPFQEASVSLGGRGSTKIVCVQSYDSEDEEVPENYWPMSIGPLLRQRARRRDRRLVLDEGVTVPQKRTDEWMELEMGEFINEEGEDGEVCFSLMETKGGNWKRGLIVQGIEIRLKKSG